MPLFQPQTAHLPYIDAEPAADALAAADALIRAEMSMYPTSDVHEAIPALRPTKFSPLIEAEHDVLASGAERQKGIDLSRYEAITAPSSMDPKETYEAALSQAYTSLEYLRSRETNLALLETYGRNAWLVGNAGLEDLLKGLEKEIEEVRAEVEALEQERRQRQGESEAEVRGLDDAWREGVGKLIEVMAAAEGRDRRTMDALARHEEPLAKTSIARLRRARRGHGADPAFAAKSHASMADDRNRSVMLAMADSTIDFTPAPDRAPVDSLRLKEPAHLPPTHPQFILLQDGPRISTYDFLPPPKRPAGLSKRVSQLALKLARRLLNRPKPAKGLTDAERQARDTYLVQSNVERFARGEMGWATVPGLEGKAVDLTSPRDGSFGRANAGCQDWESVLDADRKTLVAAGVAPANVVHDEAVLEKDPPEGNAFKGASSKDREAEKRKNCLSTVLEARESVILDGFPLAAEKYPFPKESATDLTVNSLGVLPVRYEDHLPVEQFAIDVKVAWHADDGAEPSRMKRILSLQSMRFAEKQA
ncbi:hypothetical protein LTR95_006731 [Oleoguttula sp. CCFEE 5521]